MGPAELVERLIEEAGRRLSHDTPGVAVAVATADDRSVAFLGLANWEHRVQIGADTVFSLGSCSKQFTATCVKVLEDSGDLSLQAQLRQHVPELPPVYDRITIRDLLHHTGGVRDYLFLGRLLGLSPADVESTVSILRLLCRQTALNFEPGAQFLYSNSGYLLLALIVERVAGKPFLEFARDEVFVPREMRHASFRSDPALPIPHRAAGYQPAGGGWRIDELRSDVVGPGRGHATIVDALKWATSVRESLDVGLGKWLATPSAMLRGHLFAYGRGLFRQDALLGEPALGHPGGGAGFEADIVHLLERRMSVSVLSNAGSNLRPTELIRRALVPRRDATPRSRVAQDVTAVPADRLAAWTGAWVASLTGEVAVLRVGSAGPVLHRRRASAAASRSPLAPATTADGFTLVGNGVEVRLVSDRLQVRTNGADPELLDRRHAAPVADGLSGHYVCPDGPVVWRLAVDGGDLVTHFRHGEPVRWFPSGDEDRFWIAGLEMQILREDGTVQLRIVDIPGGDGLTSPRAFGFTLTRSTCACCLCADPNGI
jgi:CubicO group peptidase (beta-lactamase class C family)